MKDFKKFILTLILTFIMTLPILVYCSNLFIPKWIDHTNGNMMTYIIKGFYKEKKNSLEVIFTGNSDVFRGVSPMVLYEKYGITSYNFVSSGERSWMAYGMFKEIFRLQKPQIIMFNVDELFADNQPSDGNYSKAFDNMKFSKVKIETVFDKTYDKEKIKKIGHILPILSYHNRYTELNKDDFKYSIYDWTNPTKGMEITAASKEFVDNDNYMKKSDEKELIPETNLRYLNKIVELCKSKKIKLILFELPSPDSWNYKKHNTFKEYAQKKDLEFLDLNLYNRQIGMDWKKDTSDGGDHLNIYGAEKVSTFIAEYLNENHDLPDRRNEKKYSKWKKQLLEYKEIKKYEIDLINQK